MIRNGVLVADLDWEQADQLATTIIGAARLAEEFVKHDQIAHHQAVAWRAGLPIGLSDNKRIIEDAKQECLYDRDLRRYIKGTPPGVRVGTPGVINHGEKKSKKGVKNEDEQRR